MTEPQAATRTRAGDESDTTRHSRLFVLELGMARPIDFALSQGTHELKDCGVAIHLQGTAVSVEWLGHGPRAFLLPGARQLATGRWLAAEDRARVSWAGREWLFLAHELGGEGAMPPRGICLNGAGAGFPSSALLLVEDGKDRGNFYRFRTEPFELAHGVHFQAVRAKDGSETMHLRVARDSPHVVALGGEPVALGTEVVVRTEQMLLVSDTADQAGATLRVIVA